MAAARPKAKREMYPLPEGFYGLLDHLRQYPAMILGERSLHDLWTFLMGYRYARSQLSVPLTEEEKEFEEFSRWVHKVFRDLTTQSWAHVIQHRHPNDGEAWDRFFALLDEFRQTQPSKDKDDNLIAPVREHSSKQT